MAKPNPLEAEVLRVLRAVWDATNGRPQAWRSLIELGLAENSIGVRRAATEGLLLMAAGRSVCLTDAGRRLADG